jgi:hypothetical protein
VPPHSVFARLRQPKSKEKDAEEEDVLYYSLITQPASATCKKLHNKFNQYNARKRIFFSHYPFGENERREKISSTIRLIKSSHFFFSFFKTPCCRFALVTLLKMLMRFIVSH